MIRLSSVALAFTLVTFSLNAQFKLNLHNSWGYNLVNIEEATGSPKFDESLPSGTRQLTDYNQFYYNGEVQLLKPISQSMDIGLAVGFNRLYYWEERYRNLFDTGFNFDFGTIWTFEVSGMANFYWGDWFGTTSFGFHSFQDGSGSTAGLSAGTGRIITLGESLSLPIVFKVDTVFGDGTTIAPNLGFGLQWTFSSWEKIQSN